ncbi:MAG: SMP-30/gluconolactonase/LRE family protein [Armatimonadota bacterium]|nr:SMP-30/gluconolactonase/LRE family protein [Armatimonadota bacterium]MDR7404434.1 SMP-30/gluconolactonase/LRE family protein [Armatimonadota bacterium]
MNRGSGAVGGLLAVALTVGWAVAGGAAPAEAPILVSGFATPKSILYDSRADVYLVSNINGSPTAADDNGFISRVAPDGRVLDLKWIDGARPEVRLNAPKGMAVSGDTLYVSDITTVRMFDRRTGEPRGAVVILGSTFVNDLAAGRDGTVYITDTGVRPDFSPSGTDAIYRLSGGQIGVVARSPDLNHPNGIAVLPDGTLVVVTFSPAGEMYTVGSDGTRRNVRRLPAGNLDGVEVLPGGALLVSSWGASAVFRVEPDGTVSTAVGNVPSPADIGYDGRRNRVLIPVFTENRIVIHPLR